MDWTIPLIVSLYLGGSLAYGLYKARRAPSGTDDFLTGGRSLGPVVVGFTMASQFLAPGNIVTVAEEAFKRGAMAGWAIITLGLAFLILSWGVASQYHKTGTFTTTGALANTYGSSVKPVTAAVLALALTGVTVVIYVAGGKALSLLLGVPYSLAVFACGLAIGGGIAAGGMRYLAGASSIHMACSLLGCGLGAWYALNGAGGLAAAQSKVPPEFFNFMAISPSVFIAWAIANLGAVGSTQSIVQIIGSAGSARTARRGAVIASLLLAIGGVLVALSGAAARVVFPQADPTNAFPILVTLMPPAIGGFVVAGLTGGLLAAASGNTLAVSTLVMKDLYLPFLRPHASDAESLRATRWAGLIAGLLPVLFALMQPQLFPLIFFARNLRVTLFTVLVIGFYLPILSGGRATWAISLGAAAAVWWFFAGNPLGIDGAYVSLLVPFGVLALTKRSEPLALEAPR
jgi:SSS family solute:Na+ symporter